MAKPRLILIGFHPHVLESRRPAAGWPDCDIVRVSTSRGAAEHLRGTAHGRGTADGRGTAEGAVVVAASDLSDQTGIEALAQLAEVAPGSRRILEAAELSDSVRQAVESGDVHAVAPADDEASLAALIRDALERCVLETRGREAAARLLSTESHLSELRHRLEEKVTERTGQLELKVRELEGRNRIAQHLMRVHTMDDTLAEVLTVLTQTLGLERAVVHLAEGKSLHPSVAIRLRRDDEDPEVYDPGEFEATPVVRRALEKARDSRQSQNVADPQTPFVSPFAVVPILREDELLGLIEVENHQSKRCISDAEVEVLTNLAVEVAVAIQDVRYHESFERWKHQLERILTEVERVDAFGAERSA